MAYWSAAPLAPSTYHTCTDCPTGLRIGPLHRAVGQPPRDFILCAVCRVHEASGRCAEHELERYWSSAFEDPLPVFHTCSNCPLGRQVLPHERMTGSPPATVSVRGSEQRLNPRPASTAGPRVSLV